LSELCRSAQALAPGSVLSLPASVRALDFISDLHLSPELPRTLAALAEVLLHGDDDGLFILGDLFEVWVGDDLLDQDFERHCADLLAQGARRRPIWLMHGNRDFLLGERFFSATGLQPLADPCPVQAFGETVLLSHGDALCLDDKPYQAFRAQVRSPVWQQAFLARPLGERLAVAAQMRAASRSHQATPVTYADADPGLAQEWLQTAGAEILIHGHTHRPGSEQRPEGWQRHVLSDWDLDHEAVPRAEVLRWTGSGFERRMPGCP
jgi:UDP-2,3-diacylglucosamine hydrolase